ncbi:phosphatase PAP2 family protein [Undibacter mobilis]|uniref:Phosphatase PAP2 family protein n=1 Tax=Undibacter mobilis TaxID=2292256 RepID=A0A371B0E9_9BRAD|nr:phosphatase PAP2 family protein [Undibacter mobilis]RDV01046.1 phosphatase PAP2 family protein [Undibacter mobilis]
MSSGTTDTAGRALLKTPRRCIENVIASFRRLFRPFDWRKALPWIEAPQQVLIGAAVVVVAAIAVMGLVDASVTRAVQRLPVWVIDLFNFVTDFGKGAWVLWPLGLFYLALAALPRPATRISQAVLAAVMVRAGFLFAAVGLPGLFASLVKNMIGRARPGVGGSINPFLFDPFHWAPAYASMPSGHGTTAFAALAAFGTLFPRARTALLIYAVIIATSRVVIRAHYVSDVMVSAAFGIVGVILVRRWFAAVHLGFAIGPDGRIVPYPGPSVRRIKAVARDLLA